MGGLFRAGVRGKDGVGIELGDEVGSLSVALPSTQDALAARLGFDGEVPGLAEASCSGV